MNSSSLLRVQGERNHTSNQPPPAADAAILNLLRLVAGNTSYSLPPHQGRYWLVSGTIRTSTDTTPQGIVIAHALIRKPRILILDEATSSLDAESESRFQQNLARLSPKSVATPNQARTTIFIIAHRLSTVYHADCILVLDRGIFVEQGIHQELMTIHGLYHHLAQQ